MNLTKGEARKIITEVLSRHDVPKRTVVLEDLMASLTRKPGSSQSPKPYKKPPYRIMIARAIIDLKQRNGSSRQAIKKYILANYPVNEDVVQAQITRAIRGMLEPNPKTGQIDLIQTKGSFRVSPKLRAEIKKMDKPRK